MRKLITIAFLLLCSCGGAVRREATETFEDLTDKASFNLVNEGDVALSNVRLFHVESQQSFVLGHPIFPITMVPPMVPMFGEMRDMPVGQYVIYMTHFGSSYTESFQYEIVYGPVILVLTPRAL